MLAFREAQRCGSHHVKYKESRPHPLPDGLLPAWVWNEALLSSDGFGKQRVRLRLQNLALAGDGNGQRPPITGNPASLCTL